MIENINKSVIIETGQNIKDTLDIIFGKEKSWEES